MEKWDVYNIDRIKTGETAVRGEKMAKGQYHLVVHACIFNSENKMLIQRRSPEKESFAGLWDVSMGGSALYGEDTREACEREVFEELGIKLDLTGYRPSLTLNFYPGFDDFYLIREDVDISRLTLQKEEVSDAKWASLDEICKMMDEGTFIQNMKSFYEYLFDLKEYTGLRNVVKGYK